MVKFKEKFPKKYEENLKRNPGFQPLCDECKIEFPIEEVLLQQLPMKIGFAGLLGIILLDDSWALVSPCCEKPHLYGFEPVTNEDRET